MARLSRTAIPSAGGRLYARKGGHDAPFSIGSPDNRPELYTRITLFVSTTKYSDANLGPRWTALPTPFVIAGLGPAIHGTTGFRLTELEAAAW